MQYLASRNTLFNLNNFLDKAALQGDLMPRGLFVNSAVLHIQQNDFMSPLSLLPAPVTPSMNLFEKKKTKLQSVITKLQKRVFFFCTKLQELKKKRGGRDKVSE